MIATYKIINKNNYVSQFLYQNGVFKRRGGFQKKNRLFFQQKRSVQLLPFIEDIQPNQKNIEPMGFQELKLFQDGVELKIYLIFPSSLTIQTMDTDTKTIQEQKQTNNVLTNESLQTMPIFSFLDRKTSEKRQQSKQSAKLSRVQSKNKDDEQYDVEILEHKVINKEFVAYRIKISRGNQYWIFQTRFSLLHSLNSKLSKSILSQLPKFPEKKLFGNLESAFLNKRNEQLSRYMKSLFKLGRSDEAFMEFVRQSRQAAIQIYDPMNIRHFQLDA